MKTFTQSCITILMTALSLSANANPCDEGGIGGTGIPLNRGIGGTGITSYTPAGISGTGITSAQEGIGGTGVTDNQKGIGGTGMEADIGIGGTGIVGIITGFGSVCVNGLEIHYYTDTPVDVDGKKISSEALSIGQVVAVRAHGKEQSLVASEIHAFHQITGPITAIDVPAKKIKVMEQSVNANDAQINNMQIGQWVSVSGLRNDDGSIEASRIDQSIEGKVARIVGNFSIKGNKVYVGGTKINGIPKMNGNSNAETRLSGVWDGNTFNVKDMKAGPVSDLLKKVEVFHVQGIAGNNALNGQVRLSGQNVTVTPNTKMVGNASASLLGKPVIVHGQMKDGKATAQSIELRPMKNELKNRKDHQESRSQSKSSRESGEKASIKENESIELNKSEHKSKKIDKTEFSDQIAKRDRVEKVERIEKVEIPEKIEKVEKVEKVEIPEKIEKVEKK